MMPDTTQSTSHTLYRIQTALQRGQMVLHYQPQVELRSRDLVGLEALIRWHSPEKGLLGPLDFLPDVGRLGLSDALGYWVIEEACSQVHHWIGNGLPPMPVAVNISSGMFNDETLVPFLDSLLRRLSLEPRLLELELTERLFLMETATFGHQFMRLRDIGVHLAIDDFGTASTSLPGLMRFPVHRLKIDQSIIARSTCDEETGDLVFAIVKMGHALGLNVLAEGVETEEQAALLKEAGCDEAQGFLFSPALPAGQIGDMLRNVSQVRTK